MSESLKNFLKRWLITTLAVLVATQIISEIRYDDWQSLVLATLTLGLLNSFLRPVLMLLSLPILLLTERIGQTDELGGHRIDDPPFYQAGA